MRATRFGISTNPELVASQWAGVKEKVTPSRQRAELGCFQRFFFLNPDHFVVLRIIIIITILF